MAYGMEGKADTNGDGIVSFGKLEEYVQNGVNDWSISNNKQQKPFVKYFKKKNTETFYYSQRSSRKKV